MAGITICQSVLERISHSHLDCPICSNRFKHPKLLDCLHSFCTECLEGLRQTHDPDSPTLVCPICRKETRLSKDGVSALGNNFSLMALVEEFNRQEELLRVLRSKVRCQQCDSMEEVVFKCTDCDHFMCLKCKEVHEQLENSENHRLVAISDPSIGKYPIGKTPQRQRSEEVRCKKHGDLFHFYCNTCQVLVCTACTALDHHSPEHDFVEVSSAEESCRKELQDLLCRVKRSKKETQDAMDLTDMALCKLKAAANQVVTEITEAANREVDKVRQREVALKRRVGQIDQDRSAVYDRSFVGYCAQLQHADKTITRVCELLEGCTSLELLAQKQTIQSTLRAAADKYSPPKLDELFFGTFNFQSKEIPQNFGQFVLSKWKLRVEFGAGGDVTTSFQMAQEVSTFADGDILTADADKNKVTVHDPKGQFKCYFDGKTDQSEKCLKVPSSISVNHQDDRLFVVDGPVVKVFNQEQMHLYNFAPSLAGVCCEHEAGLKSVDDSRDTTEKIAEISTARQEALNLNTEPEAGTMGASEPVAAVGSELVAEVGSKATSDVKTEAVTKYIASCLAVADSLVALGVETKKVISLHNLDGSPIRTLPADLVEDNLAINKTKELIFTNYRRSRLVSMDLYGNKVFSVETTHKGKLVKPMGVCCEGHSNIYVAVHLGLGRGEGEIHHYDNEGRKVGHIIQSLYNPLGLALTPRGELVVADKNSVKIFQKVKCNTEISDLTYV
ncbi:uncharacterized protein LOC119735792 [Patiria miniata]|uniref:Uncharacterized protein n=1 Tax=Patiria miniata TaxID=46514 RepID=A0A914AQD9_PATMI|nr:uncharacterized protein LOC119735792 [Patiria miniata]